MTNLSLLGPVVEGESLADTAPVAASSGEVLARGSVKFQISEIDDLLCVYQFAFWRTSPSAAIPFIVSLCRE